MEDKKEIIARVLGTASGMPAIGRAHSAFWCKLGQRNVLFDCGEGTAKKLLEYGLDKDAVDFIIISHFHPDHITGLFMVIQMLYLQERSKTLTIYLPERGESFIEIMNMFYLFPERLSYQIEIKDVNILSVDLPEIKAVMNDHLSNYREFIQEEKLTNLMNSYSFFIRTGRKNILLSSDIKTTDSLKDYITASDILIIDAIHPESEEIVKLLRQKDKRIILVHGLSAGLQEALNQDNTLRADIADDGYEISV
jgi:metal-dependent hydrolase (beta-lactamase superfamily II)